jgi:tripartite-type tricarboxylate transporter receptor subunit TctC
MSRTDPSGESVKASRRDFLRLSASGAAFAAHGPFAWGEDTSTQVYPTRPVRIVSGFPPGGISDTYARLIAQWLSEHPGEQFIVENRPGAGSTLAAEYVAKAAPDGYTLLLTTSADAWNETLYDNLNFHVPADFTSVATISRGAGVLVVNPSVPATSVPQLIAYANANRGKVTVASAARRTCSGNFFEA